MQSVLSPILLFLLAFSTLSSAFAESLLPANIEDPPSPNEQEIRQLNEKVVAVQLADYSKRLDARFALFAHHRTFLIPLSYVTNPGEGVYEPFKQLNNETTHDFYQKNESEFQISLFLPVYRKILDSNWDLNVAYSHHSWWQLYNAAWSKPFRETNYNPEVFARRLFPEHFDILGVSLFSLDVGYMHESNGQIQLVSRSWDRLFARTSFLRESYTGILTLWARRPVNAQDDDNRKILTYKGYGLLELNKAFDKITIETKINLAEKPGAEFSVSYPLNYAFRWFFKVNKGYGQSLIEYDRDTTRFGAGISLENYNDHR